jgi:hypothetical protein
LAVVAAVQLVTPTFMARAARAVGLLTAMQLLLQRKASPSLSVLVVLLSVGLIKPMEITAAHQHLAEVPPYFFRAVVVRGESTVFLPLAARAVERREQAAV